MPKTAHGASTTIALPATTRPARRLTLTLLVATMAATLAVGCIKAPTQAGASSGVPELSPEGSDVQIAMDTPSPRLAELVGPIEVHAEGREIADAEDGARAKLRNKAAAMGASLVTIDNNVGERGLFGERVKVTLVGRAFKAAD